MSLLHRPDTASLVDGLRRTGSCTRFASALLSPGLAEAITRLWILAYLDLCGILIVYVFRFPRLRRLGKSMDPILIGSNMDFGNKNVEDISCE